MSSSYIPALSSNTIPAYIKSVIAIPSLDKEEEIKLFKEYKHSNNMEAAQKIILANLKLVVSLAYKFRKFRDVADLIQEGNLGLLTALEKFDLKKDVRFSTYASWWVKAKIQEFIISHISIVRFGKSRDERKLFFNLISTIKEIETYESGQNLSTEELAGEVAKRLNIKIEKVYETMKTLSMGNEISIDATYSDDSNRKLIELKDEKTNYEEDIDKEKHLKAMHKAVETLNEREKYIIQKRYLTDSPETLEHIGEKYNISKERVRQIESKAIKKIKQLTFNGA